MSNKPRMSRSIGRLLGAIAAAAALAGCTGVAAPVQSTGYGYTCFAGAYQCRLGGQLPVGTECTCPGVGAPSYGTVR